MWIAKLKYKHDCILGNRCEKFKVTLQSVAFSVFREKGKVYTSSMHYMSGDFKNIESFIKDLKKEKVVKKLEVKGNTFFLIECAEETAMRFFNPKIIFSKPVLVDKEGYETWEIASWERQVLETFVKKVKKRIKEVKLLKLVERKVDNVYFPRLMPGLTELQKRALELAIEKGYYMIPKKIGLRKLAKMMGVSLATYQKHLQKAEAKVVPDVLNYLS